MSSIIATEEGVSEFDSYAEFKNYLKSNPEPSDLLNNLKSAFARKDIASTKLTLKMIAKYSIDSFPEEIQAELAPLMDQNAIYNYLLQAYKNLPDEFPDKSMEDRADEFLDVLAQLRRKMYKNDRFIGAVVRLLDNVDPFVLIALKKMYILFFLSGSDEYGLSDKIEELGQNILADMRQNTADKPRFDAEHNYSMLRIKFENYFAKKLPFKTVSDFIPAIADFNYEVFANIAKKKDHLGLLEFFGKLADRMYFENHVDEIIRDYGHSEESIKKAYAIAKLYMVDVKGSADDGVVRSSLPRSKRDKGQILFANNKNVKNIIYNNDGYSGRVFIREKIIKGEKIVSDDGPIGYVKYMPQGDVKSIFVQIYGGYEAKEKDEKMSKPLGLSEYYESELLKNGTMVVKLNLINLLELNVHQREMSADLLEKIHRQIHYFFNYLQQDTKLKGKPVFLYGPSFGGMMSVHHAQNFPDTFAGYISHNGALYEDSRQDHLLVGKQDRVEKIKQPILLLHTLDDNRVNLDTTLQVYLKASAVKKEHLFRLYVSPHGSQSYKDDHGHYTPGGYYGKLYAEQLIDFINNPQQINPAVSKWRYSKFKLALDMLAGKGDFVHKDMYASKRYLDRARLVQHYHEVMENGSAEEKKLARKIMSEDEADQKESWKEIYAPKLWVLNQVENFEKLELNIEKELGMKLVEKLSMNKSIISEALNSDDLEKTAKVFLDDFMREVNILQLKSYKNQREKLEQQLIPMLVQDMNSVLEHNVEKYDTALIALNWKLLKPLLMENAYVVGKQAYQQKNAKAVEIFEKEKRMKPLSRWLRMNQERVRDVFRSTLTKDPEAVKKLLEDYRSKQSAESEG